MNKDANYLDIFRPEEISVDKIWDVVATMLFKNMQPSKIQHDEMKRAFFIGFTENFKLMTDVSDRLSEVQACNVLSRINNELNKFHEEQVAMMTETKGSA